jgi:drug/metabolite transporter (DMT)-like permease
VYGFWSDLLGSFLALCAALLSASSACFVKKLAEGNVHYSIIGFYFNIGIMILGPFISFTTPRDSFPNYSWSFAIIIVLNGICAIVVVNAFVWALKICDSGTVSILLYISIPISLLSDITFFNKEVEVIELCGMAIILGVNVVIGFLKIYGVIK